MCSHTLYSQFNDWFNKLPVEAKAIFPRSTLECIVDIIICNNVPRSKFATVCSLALPPREVNKLEKLVPEFVNCGSDF